MTENKQEEDMVGLLNQRSQVLAVCCMANGVPQYEMKNVIGQSGKLLCYHNTYITSQVLQPLLENKRYRVRHLFISVQRANLGSSQKQNSATLTFKHSDWLLCILQSIGMLFYKLEFNLKHFLTGMGTP